MGNRTDRHRVRVAVDERTRSDLQLALDETTRPGRNSCEQVKKGTGRYTYETAAHYVRDQRNLGRAGESTRPRMVSTRHNSLLNDCTTSVNQKDKQAKQRKTDKPVLAQHFKKNVVSLIPTRTACNMTSVSNKHSESTS